jgi:hypothetical protein
MPLKRPGRALAILCLLAPLTAAGDNLDTLKAALKGIVSPARSPAAAAGSPASTAAAPAAPAKGAEPFSVDDNAAAPAVVPLDPRQLPDIVGIHLGMPADEALKNFRTQYQKVQMAPLVRWAGAPGPSLMEFDVGLNVLGFVSETVVVEVTPPPQKSVVWKVFRRQGDAQHRMLHADVLAGLRKKYGPETKAFTSSNMGGEDFEPKPASDAQIGSLWWLFDEQGHRLPMPASGAHGILGCRASYAGGDGRGQVIFRDEISNEPVRQQNFCSSTLVLVQAGFSPTELVNDVRVEATEMPLATRADRATVAMMRAAAGKARQDAVQKAGENKPNF